MVRIFNNFWLKILALALGLLLWFHVETEKVYNYQVTLPVTKVDIREHFTLVSNPPDSVLVVVSAKGKQLLGPTWRRLGVRINISRLQAGSHTVNLNNENTFLVSSNKNISLEDVVSPSTFDVSIDQESHADVEVTPNLVTSTEDGFAVSHRMEIVPDRVTLYGPRSLIRSITSVETERRELSGLRNNVTLTLPLVPPEGYGMRLQPDSVKVTVEVVPVKTRVYDNLPVVVYNVPVDYTARTNPNVVRVELAGPPEDIDLLNRNAITVSTDYKLATPTGMAPVKIDCPANFRVRKSSVDSVRIVIGSNARSGN
jgi:YbbR domain-containing protein